MKYNKILWKSFTMVVDKDLFSCTIIQYLGRGLYRVWVDKFDYSVAVRGKLPPTIVMSESEIIDAIREFEELSSLDRFYNTSEKDIDLVYTDIENIGENDD